MSLIVFPSPKFFALSTSLLPTDTIQTSSFVIVLQLLVTETSNWFTLISSYLWFGGQSTMGSVIATNIGFVSSVTVIVDVQVLDSCPSLTVRVTSVSPTG